MNVVFTKTEAEKFIRNAYLQQGFSSVDVVIIEDATVEAEAEAEDTKPWYPDNGNWIEVEPSYNLPIGLKKHTNVEALLCSERANRNYTKHSLPADDYDWEDVVAYKVVD